MDFAGIAGTSYNIDSDRPDSDSYKRLQKSLTSQSKNMNTARGLADIISTDGGFGAEDFQVLNRTSQGQILEFW